MIMPHDCRETDQAALIVLLSNLFAKVVLYPHRHHGVASDSHLVFNANSMADNDW